MAKNGISSYINWLKKKKTGRRKKKMYFKSVNLFLKNSIK